MNKKAIIGLICKTMEFDKNGVHWNTQTSSSFLRLTILKNGALPIGIFPTNRTLKFSQDDNREFIEKMSEEEQNDLITQINLCDGIILQGGPYSDYFEEFIAKYCYDNDIPCLGICAGYNNIIRGLNGTTKKNGNLEIHKRPDLNYAHKINLDTNSKLFSIMQVKNTQTNSIHEYIGDTLNNLKAVAFSEDGLIEAVEDKNKRFFIGVKFHPELLFQIDTAHNNIIKEFIHACKK